MKNKNLIRMAAICMIIVMSFIPVTASAALLRKGSRGVEVKRIQQSLKELGYFKNTKPTGYYGSITEAAVKRFQKDNALHSDGIVGTKTKKVLNGTEKPVTLSSMSLLSASADMDLIENTVKRVPLNKVSDLDWFSDVQYIWTKGKDAVVTDVDTGLSFEVKRTYGYNHADIEPLTKKDAEVIKRIWNGWSWERRAVVVDVDGYVIAGSMTAMPHAGLDSAKANVIINNRSGNYGRGYNLDAVKNNGVDGHMDIHFKNSRTHTTNIMQKTMQDMVKKASIYIHNNYMN